MRRVASILAVAVFSLGLFSCNADNTAEEDVLYETLANDKSDGDNR
ncbi:MAG: hypothetical protein KAJ23_09775 [Maribacter sp.]|nr:hypothetical protein [Maribacter sp.]